VTAAKIIFATGYESEAYLRHKVADLHSTYALVSEPMDPAIIQRLPYVLWETARPYFYLRTTLDHRIIIGGADEPFRNPVARDRLIGRKTKQLLKQFATFYPTLPPLDVAYAWAGTFGATQDGLAYIGQTGDFPNAYFALGYGGNGVTYSMIAARLIADAIMGRPNPDAAIFRFGR
jgi:glycine/D-amino acid oxidase-like deaminating enzyme